MKTRHRTLWSFKAELLQKSKEAALAAIKIFNDPLIGFKSEAYIVLMIIAWTYLLHAFYRSKKIDYRYYEIKGKRKKYDTTRRGAQKYWDLERCLSEPSCPLDRHVKNNLLFLINIRHEIEHQMTMSLDNYLSGRYQACVLNFNRALKELFGNKNSIERSLTYSLQFAQLSEEQLTGGVKDLHQRWRLGMCEPLKAVLLGATLRVAA